MGIFKTWLLLKRRTQGQRRPKASNARLQQQKLSRNWFSPLTSPSGQAPLDLVQSTMARASSQELRSSFEEPETALQQPPLWRERKRTRLGTVDHNRGLKKRSRTDARLESTAQARISDSEEEVAKGRRGCDRSAMLNGLPASKQYNVLSGGTKRNNLDCSELERDRARDNEQEETLAYSSGEALATASGIGKQAKADGCGPLKQRPRQFSAEGGKDVSSYLHLLRVLRNHEVPQIRGSKEKCTYDTKT